MLVLSVLGLLANIVLLFINGININDGMRALLMFVSSLSFYSLIKIQQKKGRK